MWDPPFATVTIPNCFFFQIEDRNPPEMESLYDWWMGWFMALGNQLNDRARFLRAHGISKWHCNTVSPNYIIDNWPNFIFKRKNPSLEFNNLNTKTKIIHPSNFHQISILHHCWWLKCDCQMSQVLLLAQHSGWDTCHLRWHGRRATGPWDLHVRDRSNSWKPENFVKIKFY